MKERRQRSERRTRRMVTARSAAVRERRKREGRRAGQRNDEQIKRYRGGRRQAAGFNGAPGKEEGQSKCSVLFY